MTDAGAASGVAIPVRRRSGGGSRRWLLIACMLGPLLGFMAVFYATPFVYLAQESFQSWDGEDEPKAEPTFDYYKKTFQSSRTSRALTRTFRISLVSTLIALVICYPVALLLIRAGPRLRSAMLLVIFISLAASLIVRNYGWLVVLADQGPLNALLVGLGFTSRGLRMVYSEGATIVALVHYVMPFMILPIYGSLLRIPDSYSEASDFARRRTVDHLAQGGLSPVHARRVRRHDPEFRDLYERVRHAADARLAGDRDDVPGRCRAIARAAEFSVGVGDRDHPDRRHLRRRVRLRVDRPAGDEGRCLTIAAFSASSPFSAGRRWPFSYFPSS